MSNRTRHHGRRRTGPKFSPRALNVAVQVDCLLAGCTCRPDIEHVAWDKVSVLHDRGCVAEHSGHRGVLIIGGRIR
jgi:hypothetical protein